MSQTGAPADPSFWSQANFSTSDPVNARIWRASARLAWRIQCRRMLHMAGDIGGQQSMLSCLVRPLPWVPDLVGRNPSGQPHVTVVGSSYAPFIAGYCGRSAALMLQSYVTAVQERSWVRFQHDFLQQVATVDAAYYGPLPKLVEGVIGSDRLILMDLCRASFCCRGTHPIHISRGNYEDQGGDGVVIANPQEFRRYAETPLASRWLWQRMMMPTVKVIIALGFLAEHGLLRLFWQHGARLIRRHLDESSSWALKSTDEWPSKRYAHRAFGTTWWSTQADWWSVWHSGEDREWRILPVPHPQYRPTAVRDDCYGRTPAILCRMLDG